MGSGLGVEIEDDYAFGRGPSFFFGEDQANYVIECEPADFGELLSQAERAGIPTLPLGFVAGSSIKLKDPGRDGGMGFEVKIADLRAAHEGFFPKLMGSELTPEF